MAAAMSAPRFAHRDVAVERREGMRGAHPSPSYRWACPCGNVGRWTRQLDTAQTGATLHRDMSDKRATS
jgi:hypothetical protein